MEQDIPNQELYIYFSFYYVLRNYLQIVNVLLLEVLKNKFVLSKLFKSQVLNFVDNEPIMSYRIENVDCVRLQFRL